MDKPANVRQKPNELFINRIKGVKKVLNGTSWKTRFLERNPAWNNAKDLDYLNRVYLGRTADVFVTEELEIISKQIDTAEKAATA